MKTNFTIAMITGDGIGPEITAAAKSVLDAVAARFDLTFQYDWVTAGGVSIDQFGVPLTEDAVARCKAADSVFLAAVGGAKWDNLPGHLRPERALLGIRKALGLYANIRPARLYPELKDACPLKEHVAEAGFDMVIVRELTGGMYFGERGRRQGAMGEEAYDTECYSEEEIARIARVAFQLAMGRKKRVVSIDKANVLESSRLWREVVHREAKHFPQVVLTDMLVDNAAMQLIRNPGQFDVVVTNNIFGDILSDEASELTGSIGMLPSSSLGEGTRGMYEPIHGSAPDIAGQNIANPLATILSVAMMLRDSFHLPVAAELVETAVQHTLKEGYRTKDIARGSHAIGTKEMTEQVLYEMSKM